jgi:hypothetical protein
MRNLLARPCVSQVEFLQPSPKTTRAPETPPSTELGAGFSFGLNVKRKLRACRGFQGWPYEGSLEWAEYSRPTLLSHRRVAMTIRVSLQWGNRKP